MGELVEELLLLAHLDEGRPLERRRIDLVEVVVEAIAAARAVSPRLADRVAASPTSSRSTATPASLRQVLDNLLSNVRTHTPPGTSTSVQVGVHDRRATIVVADDGPGMTAEQAAHVFERFFRADRRARASGGAGLGMAIVDALRGRYGGAHRVSTPRPVSGVRITVSLPLPTATDATSAGGGERLDHEVR